LLDTDFQFRSFHAVGIGIIKKNLILHTNVGFNKNSQCRANLKLTQK
jgi:hypothetical protein